MSAAPDKAAHGPWFVGLGDAVEGGVVHGNSGCAALSVPDNSRLGGRGLGADLLVCSEGGFDGVEVAGPVQSRLGWGEREC